MNQNETSHRILSEALVAQDEAISSSVMQELRSRLTQELETAEQKARSIRKATIIACVVLVALVLLQVLIIGLTQRYEVAAQWPVVVGGGLVFGALVVAGVLLSIYNDRYRPRVNERQAQVQMAILADLQRQIAELKRVKSETR